MACWRREQCASTLTPLLLQGTISQAYWFLPRANAAAVPWATGQRRHALAAQLATGPLVQQLTTAVGATPLATARLQYRLFSTGAAEVDNHLQVDQFIGTLPKNTELIAHVTSGVASGGTFYTDANGWQVWSALLWCKQQI